MALFGEGHPALTIAAVWFTTGIIVVAETDEEEEEDEDEDEEDKEDKEEDEDKVKVKEDKDEDEEVPDHSREGSGRGQRLPDPHNELLRASHPKGLRSLWRSLPQRNTKIDLK